MGKLVHSPTLSSFVDRLQNDEDEFRMEEWIVDCLKKHYRENDSLGPQAKCAKTGPLAFPHGVSTVLCSCVGGA